MNKAKVLRWQVVATVGLATGGALLMAGSATADVPEVGPPPGTTTKVSQTAATAQINEVVPPLGAIGTLTSTGNPQSDTSKPAEGASASAARGVEVRPPTS
ncbi:MAG: hypothetical protein JWN06_2397 [Propionibacteriaceae bacterium]|jgi:hypothetical protein|nr:hypothetical protein [Propionibacteriaceae bacterium]